MPDLLAKIKANPPFVEILIQLRCCIKEYGY
jgi:hypothetical protein